jgi:hypothetical protein
MFRGAGSGNPVGAPLEAVVRDLCETRTSLNKALVATNEGRDVMIENREILRGMANTLVEIRDAIVAMHEDMDEARREAQDFKSEMRAARGAVEANTRGRGPA